MKINVKIKNERGEYTPMQISDDEVITVEFGFSLPTAMNVFIKDGSFFIDPFPTKYYLE